MAFDGNGNYDPPAPEYPFITQTVIGSADMNAIIQDIANALTNCMTRDSQGAPSVNLNLFAKKIVNLGAATNPNDAMRKVDVETYAITATTDRDMAGFRLKNLPATPAAGTDAISANYVNTAQVDRTMNGHHLLGAPSGPYSSNEYVPKQYVNDQDALKASLAGAVYTGAQDFAGAVITVPTQAYTDSTTKAASTAFVQSVAFSTVLPNLAGNALKTLRVNAGETSAEWALALPVTTGNEGKSLVVDSTAATKWANTPRTWANWLLITVNGGSITVPDHVNELRAYVFGKGGDGASHTSGGSGGGGGGCTFGTIPCKPGDVFYLDTSGGPAVLAKGATAYLTANNGTGGGVGTGGAGATAGSIGGGLGITSSGASAGGRGGDGGCAGGGASGSPIGTGGRGGDSVGGIGTGGGGWGGHGGPYSGGGVGMLSDANAAYALAGAQTDATGFPQSRDWSNAFVDPLLRPCNGTGITPGNSLLAAGARHGLSGGAGVGGGAGVTTGNGGKGGLGAGGGPSAGSATTGGFGGFGGGGGGSSSTAVNSSAGNGGIGGGGGGSRGGSAGTGGAAAALIFWG